MSATPVLFSAVPSDVQNALNSRKTIYEKSNRTTDDFAWLIKKAPWITAYVNNPKTNVKISLSLKNKVGGIDNKDYSGVYRNNIGKENVNSTGRWSINPHITGLSIESDGDYGTLTKCTLTFVVHNLPDLEVYQTFFGIGLELFCNWGWNKSGGAGGKDGVFSGIISNFSWEVNPEGGFNCTTNAIGAGISLLAGTVGSYFDVSKSDSSNAQITMVTKPIGSSTTPGSAADNTKTTVTTKVNNYADNTSLETGENLRTFNLTTGIIEILNRPTITGLSDWAVDQLFGIGKAAFQTSELPEQDNTEKQNLVDPHYYISLEKLISLINQLIKRSGGSKFSKLNILCNDSVTRSYPPGSSLAGEGSFISANHMQVVFPGYGSYNKAAIGNGNFAEYAASFKAGDLSKCMINISWLMEVYKNMQYNQDTETVDTSISRFVESVLSSINMNSGGLFNLIMSFDPRDLQYERPQNNIVIVDPTYRDENILPYEITAVTPNSICRSINLTSKVPPAYQVVAYAGNATALAALPGTSIYQIGQDNQADVVPGLINSIADLQDVHKRIIDEGDQLTDDTVNAAQAALRGCATYFRGDFNSPAGPAMPFPLEFTFTLDGINGFIFGNVVTCNYLPSIYKDNNKTAFTITSIKHTITETDWTTDVSTVCRMFVKKSGAFSIAQAQIDAASRDKQLQAQSQSDQEEVTQEKSQYEINKEIIQQWGAENLPFSPQ